MLFVCHSKILHNHCLQFLLGVKMAPRETENNAYAKFGVTNKEHYGMLWYFLEWSIGHFRVPKNLTFKTRLSAKPLLWKWVLFASQLKITFISMASHLASLWKWAFWNSEMAYYDRFASTRNSGTQVLYSMGDFSIHLAGLESIYPGKWK